jgi:hypothetical protein
MTNWELGNDLMHRIRDNLCEIARECESTRPEVAKLLDNLALDFGPLVNRLMNDNHSQPDGMCPSRMGYKYVYFNGCSNEVFKPD